MPGLPLPTLTVVPDGELFEVEPLRRKPRAERLPLALDLRANVRAFDVQHGGDALAIHLQIDLDLAEMIRLQAHPRDAYAITNLQGDGADDLIDRAPAIAAVYLRNRSSKRHG